MTDVERLLGCLGAAYRLDLSGAEYVQQIVEAAAPLLDRGFGVFAYTYDARDRERPAMEHCAFSKRFDPSWLVPFYAGVADAGLPGPPYPTGFHAWRHVTCGQASAVRKMRPILPLFAHLGGSRDTFAMNALDASGRGLWLGAPPVTYTHQTLPTTSRV